MAPPISVSIIYNKTNTFGLTDDIAVVERILKFLQDKIGQQISKPRLVDMREPGVHCDIQFHLEIPIYSAIPWAHTNICLVNPEQWSYNYDAYVNSFDALLFRDPIYLEKYKSAFIEKGLRSDHLYFAPWCANWQVKDISKNAIYGTNGDSGFICFLAGSTSKYEYVKRLLPFWPSDIPLTIYTTRTDFAENLNRDNVAENIIVKCQDLDAESRQHLMTLFRGHLVCSQGEAYGYAAANAEVAGAFIIMNNLPAFSTNYSRSEAIHFLSNSYEDSTKVRYALAYPNKDTIHQELVNAFEQFRNVDFGKIRKTQQINATERFSNSCNTFLPVLEMLVNLVKERRPSKGIFHCPPVLNPDDCPPISIITPTYNRKELIDIAFHNILSTDYPHDKIEWVVIEDNEKTPHMACDKIISFQIQVPKIKLKYIPIEGRMSIGEKRNVAIEQASNDIILFMDDDDNYPVTSFRRRVAWLLKGTLCGKTGAANIACCTTIALYDLKRGISAVNVPPFELPFAQRISEATLTFRKSAWLERKFPNVSIAEGEDWISGRENQVIEMPPQQIIVAFSHGDNKSSRRIPPSDQPPACFWGFPPEYLKFVHGLVGIEIEEDTQKKQGGSKKSSKSR